MNPRNKTLQSIAIKAEAAFIVLAWTNIFIVALIIVAVTLLQDDAKFYIPNDPIILILPITMILISGIIAIFMDIFIKCRRCRESLFLLGKYDQDRVSSRGGRFAVLLKNVYRALSERTVLCATCGDEN